MTPKEKALELYEKHLRYSPVEFEIEYTKKACFITLDEMINQQKEQAEHMHWSCVTYWEEVKEEINKL